MSTEKTGRGNRSLETAEEWRLAQLAAHHIADERELDSDMFPRLWNPSGAFIYRWMPHPLEKRQPEYVYIPASVSVRGEDDTSIRVASLVAEWNLAWEAGHFRYKMFRESLPFSLKWLERFSDQNVYLVPDDSFHRYIAYGPIFHLLPHQTLKRFGLPMLRRGVWPNYLPGSTYDPLLPRDFDTCLSSAFAEHVWPLLNPRSRASAFSSDYPIRILAHNIDYWLPHVNTVVESRLRAFPRVAFRDEDQAELPREIRCDIPPGIQFDRPLMGGDIWAGEEEAWQATCEMVERADSDGQLRAIIDAVRSNRVEDDFSKRWSYEREDFERKLFRKRSKVKVSFIELRDTMPVHGPESEVYEDLIWEDFMGLLDEKERRIVVCIRSGITRVGEISELLGYANHSPVSKALARIRRKALEYLDS
jgi:hypothetical protein